MPRASSSRSILERELDLTPPVATVRYVYALRIHTRPRLNAMTLRQSVRFTDRSYLSSGTTEKSRPAESCCANCLTCSNTRWWTRVTIASDHSCQYRDGHMWLRYTLVPTRPVPSPASGTNWKAADSGTK